MNERKDVEKKIKFLLTLTSYSEAKRRTECVEKLESLYPYAINKNDLLIKKTNEKNKYEVYVEGGKEANQRNLTKLLIMFFLFLSLIVVAFLIYSKVIAIQKKELQKQNEIESINLEKIRIHKENEKVLKNLKDEYEQYFKERYEKIYPRLGYIYSCITKNSVIENISIDKNHFSIEIKTEDSLKVLSLFEKSKIFQNVRMIRAATNQSYEKVTISGDFITKIESFLEVGDIESQIHTYQKELEKITEKEKKNEERSLSSYMEYIKRLLKENECTLEYIQVKGDKDNTEIECFIHSTSHGLLDFLQKIQDETHGDYDIKQFSLRNGIEGGVVQTKVLFDCHKCISANEVIEESIDDDIFFDVTELEKVFAEKKEIGNKKNNISIKNNEEQKIEIKPVPVEKIVTEQLSYIGLTKINGITTILAKNGTNEQMYKFILAERESDKDFCVEINNGYYALQNGKYYEVKK